MGIKTKIGFVFLLIFAVTQLVSAQNTYWLFLRDKKNTQFSPEKYFDSKAIERRINSGVSLNDSSDFPVSQIYINTIKSYNDSILYASRWLNAVAVNCSKSIIKSLAQLSFIRHVQITQSRFYLCSNIYDTILSLPMNRLLKRQTSHLQAQFFRRNNINGKGVRIAVFDAGFPRANKIIVLKHLFDQKQIIATRNFAKEKENVYSANPHGTEVLSCIAGKNESKFMGLASGAEFLLAHTQLKRDVRNDEVNWVKALEWADKNGAQIINSSLGYTYHRYFPEDMNGKVSIVAKAAALAAQKGILVVNSMGNDGNNDWKVLSTPADADSILSVGGINPYTGIHAHFSSFGPTADFRIKPNVVAFARVIVAGQKGLKEMSGTSFSAALVTGFAACVWQMHPDYTNMDVLHEIEKSASLYPYFDYAHGYGIPQASYFFTKNRKSAQESFSVKYHRGKIILNFNPKFIVKNRGNDYIYYHIADEKNHILKYYVIDRDEADKYVIPAKNIERNKTIQIYYKGTTKTIKTSEW